MPPPDELLEDELDDELLDELDELLDEEEELELELDEELALPNTEATLAVARMPSVPLMTSFPQVFNTVPDQFELRSSWSSVPVVLPFHDQAM